jgi:hypothetical protein
MGSLFTTLTNMHAVIPPKNAPVISKTRKNTKRPPSMKTKFGNEGRNGMNETNIEKKRILNSSPVAIPDLRAADMLSMDCHALGLGLAGI